MTAEETATAVAAALNAALAPRAAYDIDDVPDPRPSQYVETTLSRRFGGDLKLGGAMGIVGYRVTARAVSRTSVASVRADLEKCRAGLEFKRLAVGDKKTTPIQFETEEPAGYDDGSFSGLIALTFAL